jgi:hypothetical protein
MAKGGGVTARLTGLGAIRALVLIGVALGPPAGFSQPVPAGTCTVSILNQSATVRPDGSWDIFNIPANMGSVRARMSCLDGGQTLSGASSLFTITSSRMNAVEEITLGGAPPTPVRLTIAAPTTRLTSPGAAVQLVVTAVLTDGSMTDVTPATAGTAYGSTNSRVATVSADGLVTAIASGRVLLTALHEAILVAVALDVVVSGDSDSDGLPDDLELSVGLDPNNPLDALADFDGDGLTNRQELLDFATDLRSSDTDDDGLLDGREVNETATNPALFDTDGDRVGDGLELTAGSDPLNRLSVNLSPILTDLEIDPVSFTIIYNTVLGEGSRRVTVTATLVDGTKLDATGPPYGTTYRSSDLTIANFGAEPGRIFAGANGGATITAENGALTATAEVLVESFAPTALSFLRLPGAANAIALEGDFAYVALGGADLAVVDIANPAAPQIAATVGFPGEGFDVSVAEGFAYVAAGSGGLVVLDIATPTSPAVVGSAPTAGSALGVAVASERAYVVDGSALRIFHVSNPAAPVLLGTIALPGRPRGVDVTGGLAVVAAEAAGVHVVDVSDPSAPVLLGSTQTRGNSSNAADLVVRESRAYVADGAFNLGGLKVVDFSVPSTPVVVSESTNAFGLSSIALEREFAFGADYFFANAVPIFNVAAEPLTFSAVLNFRSSPSFRDDEGMGVAVRDGIVYLVADRRNLYRFGTTGDSALHIGRYVRLEEINSVQRPPTVTVTSPGTGSSFRERRTIFISVSATDDVRVAVVRFLINGQPVATDFAAPFWHTLVVPEGVTQLVIGAEAEDFLGNLGTAEPVTVTVIPDTDPAVRLLAPLPGAVARAGRVLPVAVEATDDGLVAKVEFFVNGVLTSIRNVPPYRFDLLVPETGLTSLTLTAVATDNVGQTATSEAVTVTVEPNQPPIVAILQPQEGDRVLTGGTVQVSVGATDDIRVAQVRGLVDGVEVGIDVDEPFEFTFQVAPGATEVRLAALAIDSSGQSSTSEEVVLEVEPDQPPTVTILEPQNGDVVIAGDDVLVSVNAADDVGIAEVQILVDGEVVASDFDEPFELTFQVDSEATEVRLTAVAIDSGGKTTTSEEVQLAVEPASTTTAAGRVLDDAAAPVAGAEVDCLGFSEQTDVGGTFSIPGLPISEGPIHCKAEFISAEGELRAAFSGLRAPVENGVTEMGDLQPGPFLLYASFGPDSFNSPGAVALLNPDTLEGSVLEDTGVQGGIAGLAADSASRLFATTLEGPAGNRTSRLLELDPGSGAILAEIGPVIDGAGGNALSVGDLAIQPGTDALFALRTGEDGRGQAGRLYELNPATGVASLVGSTGTDGSGGLAFAPEGSLFTTRWNAAAATSFLRVLDSTNGSTLSEAEIANPFGALGGLAVRPSDGLLLGTLSDSIGFLVIIDPASGLVAPVDLSIFDIVDDLAFMPLPPPEQLTTLAGRVIDDSGSPVEGVLITLRDVYRSVSGSDGRFVISRVPVSFGEVVVSVPPSWFSSSPAESAPTSLVAGGTTDVGDIVLEADNPPTTVVGIVVDELEQPIPGAAVKIFDDFTISTTTTAGDGSFTVTNVSHRGGLRILATAEVGGVRLRELVSVDTVPGGITDAGPITVYPFDVVPDPLTTATGIVIDRTGDPVAGARVHVYTVWDVFPGTTGTDGRYSIPGIPTVDDWLEAFASVRRQGRLETGNSGQFEPVPGGITDLEWIEIREEDDGGGGVRFYNGEDRDLLAFLEPNRRTRVPFWCPVRTMGGHPSFTAFLSANGELPSGLERR